jgi:hypothetical protein
MLFMIRSGVQILSDHPRLYWTRHSTPGRDWFRIQKPVPEDPLWTAKQDSISLPGQVGLPGLRHSIGLARWWHLSMDLLWLVNGIVFYVLLFATPQWQRLVPTSWSVFPDALSVLGFWLFAVSMAVIIVAWVAATPFTIRHPRGVDAAARAATTRTTSSSATGSPSRPPASAPGQDRPGRPEAQPMRLDRGRV